MPTIDHNGAVHDDWGRFSNKNTPQPSFDLPAPTPTTQQPAAEALAADYLVDDRGGICGNCFAPVAGETHTGSGSKHCLVDDVERALGEMWDEHAFEARANDIRVGDYTPPVIKRLSEVRQGPATAQTVQEWNAANEHARFDVNFVESGYYGPHFEATDRRTGASLYEYASADDTTLEEFVAKVEVEYERREKMGAAEQIRDIEQAALEDPYGGSGSSLAEHVVETAVTLHPETQRFILGDRPEDIDRWGFRFGGRAVEKIAAHPDLTPDVRERILKGNDRLGWGGLAERDDLSATEIRELCKKGRENAAAVVVRNLDPARVGTDMRATVIKVAKSRTDTPYDRQAHNAARAKIREFLDTATPEQVAKANLPKEITDRLDHVEAYGTEWLVAHNID